MILSPITSKPAKKIKSVDTSEIIQKYTKTFNLDISQYLGKYDKVDIYECEQTGYRFYYPFDILGDSKFYEHLQQYDWYYMPWKWEHQQATKYVNPNMNVLEVGCASGAFLKKLKELKNANVTGLELNQSVSNSGVEIKNETIQNHALNNKEKYDIVCSFQVLEHVSDVKSFIQSQIDCLKTGGKLIISVPNNDSFIKDSENILNMPPHHVGLWNKKSLSEIIKYFDIKLENYFFEPMQQYHLNYFNDTIMSRTKKNFKIPIKLSKKISFLYRFLSSKSYKGFTIIAIYEKI